MIQQGHEGEAQRPRIAYFSLEVTNEGIRRRVNEAMRMGFDVTLFSFRRPNPKKGAAVPPSGAAFRNIDLGVMRQIEPYNSRFRAYVGRGLRLCLAIGTIVRNRRALLAADVVVARGLEMGFLALIARVLLGGNGKFVYEIADIRRQLVRETATGRLLRASERILLRHVNLLMVSSPGFLTHYFKVYFDKLPPTLVIENKISIPVGGTPPSRQPYPALACEKPVWVIGYFGKLRCLKSLRLLADLARRLPDRVQIYIRGYPLTYSEDVFNDVVKDIPNVLFGGSYRTPDDLQDMMSRIHLNWCLDFIQADDNSRWLLPNRIYEGGYFAIPAIGLQGAETGTYIQEHKLGYVLPAVTAETLTKFIRELTPENYGRMRASLEATSPDRFVDDGIFPRAMKSLALRKR